MFNDIDMLKITKFVLTFINCHRILNGSIRGTGNIWTFHFIDTVTVSYWVLLECPTCLDAYNTFFKLESLGVSSLPSPSYDSMTSSMNCVPVHVISNWFQFQTAFPGPPGTVGDGLVAFDGRLRNLSEPCLGRRDYQCRYYHVALRHRQRYDSHRGRGWSRGRVCAR